MEIYDLTIIGAGPAGLFAGFYAGMRKAKTKIIDSLPQIGGQLNALYPEKYIYDVPGFAAVKAADLISSLEQQLQPFHHTFCLEEKVIALTRQDNLIQITTDKTVHYSRAVILAVGSGAFEPRKLAVPGAEALEHHGLEYFVNSVEHYRDKIVAIAGGGDSAIDWALTLEPIAKDVYLIHRRDKFRGLEHSVAQLQKTRVKMLTPYVIHALSAADQALSGLTLKKTRGSDLLELAVDQLIVSHGFGAAADDLSAWGLVTASNALVVQQDMATNIPGIYAIGDSAAYDGKVRLIATGFGEAPTAVNNALHFIDPENQRQPKHSTSLFAKEAATI